MSDVDTITIELNYKEAEIIRKGLQKFKRELAESKSWCKWNNGNHKKMIDLLEGNENNKLAKARLKEEKRCFEDNNRAIKAYDIIINEIDLLLDNKIMSFKKGEQI